MKRLPAIFAALLFLTSCRENTTVSDQQPTVQANPPTASDAVPTNEELSAYAEEHLAAYRYHDAAAWAYELKRRGITLPIRLQQVLDEERYDPDAPCPPAVSTTSGRSKSTCCGRKRKTATRPPPNGCGDITDSLRNKRPTMVAAERQGSRTAWMRCFGLKRIAGRRFPLPLRLNQERPSESFRRPLSLPVCLPVISGGGFCRIV